MPGVILAGRGGPGFRSTQVTPRRCEGPGQRGLGCLGWYLPARRRRRLFSWTQTSSRQTVRHWQTAASTGYPCPRQARRSAADWSGEKAAIYCRISHANDDDQTGVDRQERICRDTAERLNLTVPNPLVFVDNNRSAWKRNRKRPGWDALLEAVSDGQVRHILTCHPDRLMRQPHDLEQLLHIAGQCHGRPLRARGLASSPTYPLPPALGRCRSGTTPPVRLGRRRAIRVGGRSGCLPGRRSSDCGGAARPLISGRRMY
ncbi:recombinase family protein [Streptomyces mirabilis]